MNVIDKLLSLLGSFFASLAMLLIPIMLITGAYIMFTPEAREPNTNPNVTGRYYNSREQYNYAVTTDDMRYYIDQMSKMKERNDQNTWNMQLFLINRGLHDLAEQVTLSKTVLDMYDVHFIGITAERIDNYIEEDKKIWREKIIPNEVKWDCEEWQFLRDEHFAILREYERLSEFRKNNLPKEVRDY